MNYHKEQSEKWGRVTKAFKEVFTDEVMEDVAKARRSLQVETMKCPDCGCLTQCEWVTDEAGEHWECLQCGCNINL
jgi:hypothetical protein